LEVLATELRIRTVNFAFSLVLATKYRNSFSVNNRNWRKMNSNTCTTTNTTSDEGDTYGELPEESGACLISDDSRKERDGVQFRSQSSIEAVRRISRASNYNMEERIDYWGDNDEEALRKSELQEAVKDMHYNRRVSDSDFTSLGIDDKAGHGRAVRKVNKMISRTAVMDEQNLQRHEGTLDDDLLADIYSITSTAAKREAQIKAQRLHDKLVRKER
jgi:hypothetical protein